jgi:hypothetical protein
MIDGYIDKTPTEKKALEADFAGELPSGDTLKAIGVSSATTAVAEDSAGLTATSTVIDTVSIVGSKLRIVLKAGSDNMDYKITARAEMTTAATIFDKVYDMRVRAKRRSF